MDDKKAAEILMELLKKYPLNNEEKEAIESAIGLFSWTSLAKSRMNSLKKKQKDKLDKSIK